MPAFRRKTGRKSYKRRAPKRRSFKRRTFKRRGNRTKISCMRPKGLFLADTAMVKFKYVENFAQTNATGNPNTHFVFAGNGLADPNLSNTGHQPLYFDQYGLMYKDYYVAGSKIKVEFINTGPRPVMHSVIPSLDTFSNSTWLTRELDSQKYCKTRTTCPLGSGSTKTIIQHYMTTDKIFGMKDRGREEEWWATCQLGAQTNPITASLWYWSITNNLFTITDVTAGDVAVAIRVTITYYAKLFGRVTVDASTSNNLPTSPIAGVDNTLDTNTAPTDLDDA